MNALRPIVARHAVSGVSRADIWALSAVVATDVTQRDNSRINFDINWWGRVDCENTGQPCLGADGSPVVCMDSKGPHREMPGKDMNTHDLYNFFATDFGFSQRETVVIMGAHTLGVVREEVRGCDANEMRIDPGHFPHHDFSPFLQDFGIDGSNGWVLENAIFDNGYYHELVGGTSVNDPVEVLVNDAPAWRRIIENAIRFWVGFPSGVRVIMLNTDISLVRQLDDSNFDKSIGRATCTFEDNTATASLPVCPHVEGALQAAAEFMHDNLQWLQEFRDVLDRMLTNGYGRTDCADVICPVTVL
jgi:Peroxidase